MKPGAVPLGRYTLGERLGVGGMGEVYLAIATGLGGFEKPLALKLLLPHVAEKPGRVARFLEEAQVAAKMNHVNVAQIFDVGTENGRYFIAMELVRGVSLSALIKALKAAGQKVPADVVAYIARAVCDGLHHAHELGVVHRDVTPHNVLVSIDGAVKLTDFGIARADGVIGVKKLEGKAAYIAPEQVAGAATDRRADLFSLGVSLYHLATLESPFRRGDDRESMAAVTKEQWAPLAALRPDLPPALVQALERASAKSPDDRFPDARAMREAVPAPQADAVDHLSSMVRSLCARDVEELDARTKVLVTNLAAPGGTESLQVAPLPRSRWPLVVAALVLAAAVSGGLAWRPEVPVPVVATVTVPVPATEAEPEPEPEPAPAPTPEAKPTRKAKPAGTGYLTIDATPWAEVHVDGKRVGETPIAKYPIDADGRAHEVELSNPETKRSVRRSVRVSSGQHTFVRADLK